MDFRREAKSIFDDQLIEPLSDDQVESLVIAVSAALSQAFDDGRRSEMSLGRQLVALCATGKALDEAVAIGQEIEK